MRSIDGKDLLLVFRRLNTAAAKRSKLENEQECIAPELQVVSVFWVVEVRSRRNVLRHGVLHDSLKPGFAGSQFQRLEFLGDRVLSLAIVQQAMAWSVSESTMQVPSPVKVKLPANMKLFCRVLAVLRS